MKYVLAIILFIYVGKWIDDRTGPDVPFADYLLIAAMIIGLFPAMPILMIFGIEKGFYASFFLAAMIYLLAFYLATRQQESIRRKREEENREQKTDVIREIQGD